MLRIAIVEDVEKERNLLKSYVQQFFTIRNEVVEILCFDDGDIFVDEYPSPDLILMDIEMKRMDGISAAQRIRRFDEHVMLLFVTNMVNYALEGYSVDAADFIVKPVSYEAFCLRMNRALRKLDTLKDKYLEVHVQRKSTFVNIRDILYAETYNKKTALHCTDGTELVINDALYTLEEQLSGCGFFRCHSAFLINMERVSTVTAKDVIVGKEPIPISKHRKKEFLTALTNFRGRIL